LVKARVLVKGNVRDVGYRTFAKLYANRLGIKGLVKNIDGGAVELFLDGPKGSIKKFLQKANVKGNPEDPLSLFVKNIEIYWEGMDGFKSAWKNYNSFEVDYGTDKIGVVELETLESLEASKLQFSRMSQIFNENFSGLRNDTKEMYKGFITMKDEVKGMRNDFGGMRGDVVAVKDEVKGMRDDMNKNFVEMAERYDVISEELLRTRGELTRAVDTLVQFVKTFTKEQTEK